MRNIPAPNNANHPTFLIRRFALSPEKRPYRFDKSYAAPTINYRIWKTNVQTGVLGSAKNKKRFLGAKTKVSRHPRERSPRRRSRFPPLDAKFVNTLSLAEQLDLAGSLLALEPDKPNRPNELPGRYGRVVRDLERLFNSIHVRAAVAGGWAVWHHGYVGRVTQDIDVVVPANSPADIAKVAPLCGFDVVAVRAGIWPKLVHRETKIDIVLMPEAGIPGIAAKPAPVAIRHPSFYGAVDNELVYVNLEGLFELKLGAHRAKDIADLIELIKVNPTEMPHVSKSLNQIHNSYATELAALIIQAQQEQS